MGVRDELDEQAKNKADEERKEAERLQIVATRKKLIIPSRTDKDLKKLAKDIVNNIIFTDR